MAHTTEVKFSDLQSDERYKRLERALKLASLRKGKKLEGDDSWPLLTSPSISSINADPSDSSTNVPFLQASRIGSEVVSSSNNLRNILLKRKDFKSDHKMIATSSIKKFNTETDHREDHFIMPPPNCNHILHTFKKSNSATTCNIAKTTSASQTDCTSSDIDKESPKKRVLSSLQTSSNTVQNTQIRIFTRWKVMLNEEGHLIIRGMIDCGQIARSKPIVRRLTTTTVQSISKHVYYLQGDIVDDEYELPDYVRDKFHSGFPDDWQNIYQIWRTFVHQGSKLTFRWPTPIADSDDDLKSEVTDITYAFSNSPEDKISSFKSFKETHTSRPLFNSKCTCNVLQSNKDRENHSPRSHQITDLVIQTHMSNMSRNLCHNVAIQPPTKQCSCEKETYKQQESIASNCSYIENKTNKLRDKLNGIVDNLADKNCPQEFMSKIIEIFDCLNYVVSHGPIKDDESNTEASKLEQNKCTVQEQRNEASGDSREYCPSESIPLQIAPEHDKDKHSCSLRTDRMIIGNKTADYDDFLQKKRTFIDMNKDKDNDDDNDNDNDNDNDDHDHDHNHNHDSSDSGSEIYAGVPKISAERVLRQKEMLIKPCKRKVRKQLMYQKHNIIGKEYLSNVSRGGCSSEIRTTAKVNSMNFNDSSVSITEDETECLRVNKFINNTNVEGNESKHYNFNMIERGQQEKANPFIRDESTHEMQEHFVQEHSTNYYGSTKTVCDSCNVNENNECEINGSLKRRTNVAETNSDMEIFKGRNENLNHQPQDYVIQEQPKELSAQPMNIGKKMSKPVVISSVPIGIVDVMRKQGAKVDVVQNENREVKKPNEDMRSLKQKESHFIKKPNSIRNTNLVSLIDKKQDHEARSNVQLSNVNSTILKTLMQNESNVSIGDQDDCRPKLLSAWIPRVICKSGLYLIFEGKLLNDVGHVVHRKFKTDSVLRRVSLKLIETVNHEFYELIGDINDAKHVVPKELLHQCRYGCPSRIDQFCKIWESLQSKMQTGYISVNDGAHSMVTTAQLNDTVDTINVAVSSKGRRIIPPLNYWTGERIIVKGNNPIYNPGTLQESLLMSSYKSPSKSTHLPKPEKQETNKSKKSNSDESKGKTASILENSVNITTTKDLKIIESIKHRKFITKKKRRAAQQTPLGSTDSSDNENVPAHKKQKVKANQREPSNTVDTRSKQNVGAKLITRSREPKVRANGGLNTSKQMFMSYQSSAERYRDITCTFYRDISFKDDILSEDQDSRI